MHTGKALAILLILDALVILVYVALTAAELRLPDFDALRMFELGWRGSVGSVALYYKWLFICLVFAMAAWRARAGWVAGLALLFFLLLIDDWGEVHEAAGDLMVERYGLPSIFGLDPDDLGELLFLIPLGLICFGLMIHAIRAAPSSLRAGVITLFFLLIALSFFGVAVDLLKQVVTGLLSTVPKPLETAFSVLEDGGELCVGSALVVFSARLARRIAPRDVAREDSARG